MTAPTVRTASTSQARRAPRLMVVVAMLVTAFGSIGASALTAAPAGAAVSTVAAFRGETLAIAADGEPGGTLNNLRATLVINHDPGVSITGIRTNRNGGTSGGYGTGGYTVRTMNSWDTTHSIVEVAFSPGTGNWPGFTDPFFGGGTRKRTYNACVQVNTSNGETAQQCWNYDTASSKNDSRGGQDYPNFEQNYGTAQGTVFNSSTAAFPIEYSCDDADSTGDDGVCDQTQLRLRNVGTGATVALRCDIHRTGGDGCETRGGAPAGAWNADDNTRRNYTVSIGGLDRGKWIIEGWAGYANNSYGAMDWAWLGWIYVNPTAPTLTVTSGTDTRPDGSYHPNTGAGITYTANVSGDGQLLDWDADLNTGNGLESRERASMNFGSNAGGVPTLSLAQRQRTINTSALGSGVSCAVRAQLRDSGYLAAVDWPAASHSQVTGIVAPTCITNRIPTGANQDVDAHQGTPVAITLDATDGDEDPTTCEIVDPPDTGSLGGAATSCSRPYTPNLGANRTDTFTYRVKDDHSGVSTTYTVTIDIQNAAPTAEAQDIVVYAGEPTLLPLVGSDPDGDAITSCEINTGPTKGTLTGTGCALTYTSGSDGPNMGKGGLDFVEFTTFDGSAHSDPAPIDITLRNPNLSVTKAHTGRFNEGAATGTYTITVSNSNTAPAYGTTTITDTLPAGMTFSSAIVGASGFSCAGTAVGASTVTCTRTTVFPRNSSVQVQLVVDVAAGTASPSINSVKVTNPYELATTAANNTGTDSTNINRPPTMVDQTVATAVGAPVAVTFSGVDPNGDALTYATNSPGHGTITGTGASRTYTPEPGFQGIDTFAVQATDTGTPGLSATATVTVWVGVRPLKGTVTDEVTGSPVAGVEARLVDLTDRDNEVLAGTVVTDAQGRYDYASLFPQGLPNGSYGIRFVDPARNHIAEWYDDGASSATATLIVLSPAPTAAVRDVELTPGGRVQGTVRSASSPNAPIDGMQVRLFKVGGSGSTAATTNSGGQYRFDLLRPGTYQLWFRDMGTGEWISEWYSGATSQETSTTVTVTTGQQVTIDEQISPVAPPPPPDSGTIAGTVRSAAPGNAPVAGIQVRIYRDPYTKSTATVTDANGQYSFTRLAPGDWKIWFRDVSGTQYLPQYNGDASTLDESDAVTLSNNTELIDVQLTPKVTPVQVLPGGVGGTVTELDGVTPIAGMSVRLYPVGGTTSKATTTAADGTYSFANLPVGQYQLAFRDTGRTYVNEWNLDQPTQSTADVVAATSGTTTTVNASIARR